jgi:hypothetical protein
MQSNARLKKIKKKTKQEKKNKKVAAFRNTLGQTNENEQIT